jgi:hypothetical protein
MVLGLAAAAGSREPEAPSASDCRVETIGIDTSQADGVDGVFFGRAFGQVFLAQDTLIKSITVWRPAGGAGNGTPVRLYITETRIDPYGFGPAPKAWAILFTGDTLSAFHASGIPVPLRWEFDPPVSLPGPGYYAFCVKDDDYYCSGIFSFLVDSTMSYPDGGAWWISPTIICDMGPGVSPRPWDLVFTLEFCATPVQTRPESWGRVKATYR